MTELAVRTEALLELDARQSGDAYYQLVLHVGSGAIALIARQQEIVRGITIPKDKGNDAMAHPEAYLASPDVIYGGDYDERIEDI